MAQGTGEDVPIDGAFLAQHLHASAHDLREDDTAVAPSAHERRLGDRRADLALGEMLGQPGDGLRHALYGEREIGARVAVGHRIDVEIVDLLFALLEGRKPSRKQIPSPGYGE